MSGPQVESMLYNAVLDIKGNVEHVRGAVEAVQREQQGQREDLAKVTSDVSDIRLVLRLCGLINGNSSDGSIMPIAATGVERTPEKAHPPEAELAYGRVLSDEALDPVLGALLRRFTIRYWRRGLLVALGLIIIGFLDKAIGLASAVIKLIV